MADKFLYECAEFAIYLYARETKDGKQVIPSQAEILGIPVFWEWIIWGDSHPLSIHWRRTYETKEAALKAALKCAKRIGLNIRIAWLAGEMSKNDVVYRRKETDALQI